MFSAWQFVTGHWSLVTSPWLLVIVVAIAFFCVAGLALEFGRSRFENDTVWRRLPLGERLSFAWFVVTFGPASRARNFFAVGLPRLWRSLLREVDICRFKLLLFLVDLVFQIRDTADRLGEFLLEIVRREVDFPESNQNDGGVDPAGDIVDEGLNEGAEMGGHHRIQADFQGHFEGKNFLNPLGGRDSGGKHDFVASARSLCSGGNREGGSSLMEPTARLISALVILSITSAVLSGCAVGPWMPRPQREPWGMGTKAEPASRRLVHAGARALPDFKQPVAEMDFLN